jgi:hypothetical protein
MMNAAAVLFSAHALGHQLEPERRTTEWKIGDLFVVSNARDECWDGERWVVGWGRALQFKRPAAAYELCEEAAREAERLTGVRGAVTYIQPYQRARKSASAKSSTAASAA